MAGNGRAPGSGGHDDEDEDASRGDLEPAEYESMLVLERLESLQEDMEELGVRTLDDVRRRIEELHRQLDEQD